MSTLVQEVLADQAEQQVNMVLEVYQQEFLQVVQVVQVQVD
jgi:hypothetical protein